MELHPVEPISRWWSAAILEISDDGTDRPNNFVFDYRCLLSAASEPTGRDVSLF